MKKFIALALAATVLGGCGVFGGGKTKPATPTVGQRVPVLAAESEIAVDPETQGVAVQVPAPVANTEWSQPGGNASHAPGHVALGGALAVAWTADIGAGSVARARLGSGPVVGGGRLYTIDNTATIRAFDAASGAAAWSARLANAATDVNALFGGGVSFENGTLYATNGIGQVAALDAATGRARWTQRPGGPLRGAPTVSDGNLYVVSQDNQLFALDPATGETRWSQPATLEVAGVFGAAAPAAAQGTVVAGFSSGELNAYRYENGRPLWQDVLSRTNVSTAVAALSDIDAEPVIENGRVYAVGQGGRMVALELVTGQRLWEQNIAGISTPWVAGDWLFVVTADARLVAMAKNTGRIRWITQLRGFRDQKDRKGPVQWVGPVLAGGRLILASSLGDLVAASPSTGAVQTITNLRAPVEFAPVVANNTMYVLDSRGRLTAFR